MILNRLVELQAHTVIRKITETQAEYEFIENLIESQKPPYPESGHHYLIKTPFRYSLPVEPRYSSRFKAPFYTRNCLYAAREYRTSAYEYVYHWLSERIHISGLSQEPQGRTHFTVSFEDPDLFDLTSHPDVGKIMDRRHYGPSHRFMESHPEVNSILYPSCRDPQRGDCVVTFEINTLGKKPLSERSLYLIYEVSQKKCRIEDPLQKEDPLEIFWSDLC